VKPYTHWIRQDEARAELVWHIVNLQNFCHQLAEESGWWRDLHTGTPLTSRVFGATRDPRDLRVNVPEKLMLIVSELGEAMEAFRKNLADDKLPHRMGLEVELADAVIRIFDLAGGIGLDLPTAIVEKLRFNTERADHKPENRLKEGGKAF
jgi:hypothetical protein